MPHPDPTPRRAAAEPGIALILVLIFTVLLYAMVADLVTTARTARLTGEGDALLDRMRNHQAYTMAEVEQLLLDDLVAASAGGEEGGLPGMGGGEGAGALPGSGGEGGEAGAGEEGEEDPSATADGSQDGWYESTSYAEGEITTYLWIEDENRKFNVLSLVSPDQEFADKSKQRFARIVDYLREGTEFDLSLADGNAIADALIEWMKGQNRSEILPRPPLKSDVEASERSEISLLVHMEDLMLLRNVDEDLFYDKVLDGRRIPGLESVFTCYTAMAWDPGTPEQRQRRAAAAGRSGGAAGEGAGGEPAAGGGEAAAGSEGEVQQPSIAGLGIAINLNTAPPAVLYGIALDAIPRQTIEAILRYRNEEAEQDPGAGLDQTAASYFGDIREGQTMQRKMFTDVAELEDIEEWSNIADEDAKSEFLAMVGVQSDVFSVHMASVYRKNEQSRNFTIQRARAVVMRHDNGEDGYLHPLIPLEERPRAQRLIGPDFPDDVGDPFLQFSEMDAFTREERSWNPFHLEFFLPDEERERLFGY